MVIDERSLALTLEFTSDASEVGWFASRQPGLIRFLEDRLGDSEDGLAFALDLCWRILKVFNSFRAAPVPRIECIALERAEINVVRESQGELLYATGCAHRQPELCHWLESEIANSVLPITAQVLERVAMAVAATISVCDLAQLPLHSENSSEPLGALLE